MSPVSPVSPSERISSVDVIRGVALLGILLMNIVSFGLPGGAYMDPTIAGGATGMNLAAWLINQVLFEGKMRAIFSMLFGAGAVILTARAEERGGGGVIADIYCRRNLWLLLFGLLHGYFLWEGDILYSYALTALLLLYPLRKLAPKVLIAVGLLVLATQAPKNYLGGHEIDTLRDKARQADAAAAAGKTLTEEQKEAQKAWTDKLKELKPDAAAIQKVIDTHRAGYWKLFAQRAGEVTGWNTGFFYRFGFWDTAGMMLLGMGLLKLGVFSAACSFRVYVWMALAGYGIGVPVNWWVGHVRVATNFEPAAFSYSFMTYDLGRLSVALGHIALVMLVCKAGTLGWLTSRLAAVGQMALTNYLTDTLVATTLFYGYGFGLYGKLQRHQLYYVVISIWIVQLIVSPIWLRHFRYGPAEWVWRSLTYWQRQPMRFAAPEPSGVPEATPAGL